MIDDDTEAQQRLNGVLHIIAELAKCLARNRALGPDELQRGLLATLNHPDAPIDRADYKVIRECATIIDDVFDEARLRAQLEARVGHG